MAYCLPIDLWPMTMQSINEATQQVESVSNSTWMIFPHEIEQQLAEIIKPYVDTSKADAKAVVRRMLGRIEMSCRYQFNRIPWAIVFFPEQYPLSGHLLSIRSGEDVRFSAYSVVELNSYDPNVQGAPPLSILWFFSKESLLKTAEKQSPLISGIFDVLHDADEDGCWTMIANPLDQDWVREIAKTNSDLFFIAMQH